MHGRIYRYDDPIWKAWYPPNGFNCRCTVYTVSETEMERNGWNVSAPLSPGVSPDAGFGGQGEGSLADAYAAARRGKGEAFFREANNQPGPKDLGRPTEREIPATAWLPSPGKIAALDELVSGGMTQQEALLSIERAYRNILGMSPMETTAVLIDPMGEAVKADFTGIAHAMLKRDDARERYIPYLRQTIENPYEILLTEYVSGVQEKRKLRKKYIGLFRDEQNEAVIIVAETGRDGKVLWNVMNAKRGTIDRQRRGRKVLYV